MVRLQSHFIFTFIGMKSLRVWRLDLDMAGFGVDLVAHGLGLGGPCFLGHHLLHHHRSDPHRLIQLGGPQAGGQALALLPAVQVLRDCALYELRHL